MDVARYSIESQKVLYGGIKLAKGFGHIEAEVEHVALFLINKHDVLNDYELQGRLKSSLGAELEGWPKVFGISQHNFGSRLKIALTKIEGRGTTEIAIKDLWRGLASNSTIIKNLLSRDQVELKKQREFRPLFDQDGSGGRGTPSSESKLTLSKELNEALKKYTVDFTEMADNGKFDQVFGRDLEVRRILEILGRKKKNNPLLLGEAGVGKSAIAELLAMKISKEQVPETMIGKRVLSLDLGALLAGAKFRGEFEERLKSVIDGLVKLHHQVIVFIDEIHMIVGAGNNEGGADAANLLKPALARGEILCLGATTADEYKKVIQRDPALERRFQPVLVEEPSPESSLNILRGLKEKYESHHNVKITDSALRAAVEMSTRFISDRQLPDKAIDLIDESCAKVRMSLDSVPTEVELLRGKISELSVEKMVIKQSNGRLRDIAKIDVRLGRLEGELEEVESLWRKHQALAEKLSSLQNERQELLNMEQDVKLRGDYNLAAVLRMDQVPRIDTECKNLDEELSEIEQKHAFLGRRVDERAVAEVLGAWTGIPVGRLLADEKEVLSSLQGRLGNHVFGQDKALTVLSKAIRKARLGIGDPARPTAVLMFLGPTGVGKTETAKALGLELFGSEDKLIRFDMSEYAEPHNVARLIGSPPGYVGYGSGGELTEAVRKRPYSIVLFDEVEKAHPKVFDLFLQLFDEGRISDGEGRVVDCRNIIFIMTSNLAISDDPSRDGEVARHELRGYFRPELVNRIDEVISFKALGNRELARMCSKYLENLNNRLIDRDFRVVLGSELLVTMVNGAKSSAFGGRSLKRLFERYVVDSVTENLLSPDFQQGAWVIDLDSRTGEVFWELENEPTKYLPRGRV